MAIRKLPKDTVLPYRVNKNKRAMGQVVKEVGIEHEVEGTDYWKCIQLIRWKSGSKEREEIRFGYYWKESGKPKGGYRWGSQTTLVIPKNKLTILLRKAIKEGILERRTMESALRK